MRKLVLLVVILIMAIALAGCQETPKTTPYQPAPTPSIAVDRPSLYASEAIRIAKQHSLTSPVNTSERHAATHIRRLEALGGYDEFITFEAAYEGNGEWIVLLRVLAEPPQPRNYWLYRWRVFDKTSSVAFLDETVLYP